MNPQKYPQRKSPRLKDYDYAQNGAYFVTICTQNRVNLCGQIAEDGVMQLNKYGESVWKCWNDLPNHYENIELDVFVVMPNHIHGIILINDISVREGFKPSPTNPAFRTQHGLTEIIRALKTFSSRYINEKRNKKGISVWQRSFHDHIIRNETELTKLREYVLYNPSLWAEDKYHSDT